MQSAVHCPFFQKAFARDSDDTHLVALTAHGAFVETGERDIYLRRNPPVPGQVLTWEVGEWRRTGQEAS